MIGTPEMMKRVNINSIFQVLIETRSATRLELAQRTKISLTTIRIILDELILNHQIIETMQDVSSGGRRAQRYALSPTMNLILTFCLEDDSVVYQITTLNNDVVKTGTSGFGKRNITDFIEKCMAKWNICVIGIGVPGIVDKGSFLTGCEMGDFIPNNIGEILEAKYHIPVILENNLNATAYGYGVKYLETHRECTCQTINLAYVRFDKTSTSAGFIVDGKVLRGANQFAGELGFMPIKSSETLDSVMASIHEADEFVDMVSRTLAIISCVTNPALIVIGGDRFAEEPIKAERISKHLRRHYLSDKVCPSITVSNCLSDEFLLGMKQLTLNHIIPFLPLKPKY